MPQPRCDLRAPLRVKVRLVNKVKDEVIDQDVFMGDLPLMTENGSFIINGAERVIVSQLVRSPGVNNVAETDKTGKKMYETTVIPNRGAWLEFKQDAQGVLWVSVDRKRKLAATVLLRALGFGSNRALEELFRKRQDDRHDHREGYDPFGIGRPHRTLSPPAPR